jgi:type I restriction enzyme, S subunit
MVGKLFNMQLGKMLSKIAKVGRKPFPYLANKNVQWDKVDLSDLEWMDFNPLEREKFRLLPNDLLVCEGGDIGRTAIWNGELEHCYFQKAIHRLRPINERTHPRYMLRYMRYAVENGYLKNLVSQTSISHLTQEKLAILPVRLPSLAEQNLIVEMLDIQDKTSEDEEITLSKFIAKKKGLMDDLLTGRIRVSEINSSVI